MGAFARPSVQDELLDYIMRGDTVMVWKHDNLGHSL